MTRPEWTSDGVTLPRVIEEAFDADELVFFCGAGVSSAPPSKLPGFRGLASDIASNLGHPELVPEDESIPVQFDVVMGKLDELSTDIHSRVSARLRGTVVPNDYHRDLWQIASAQAKTPRIVTTNFDLLFEAAAAELKVDATKYVAPALPLGDDFCGLVHLHGVVDPPVATRMVLTDQDFGRAYITEGWATQFLTRMFGRYTVVLIGYSAEDSIVQYLNRALPAGTKRLAFTKNASEYDLWDRLGITPVPFPSTPEDEYGALQAFIKRWRQRVSSDAAEQYDSVTQFVDGGPNAAEADVLQSRWLLSDPKLARHFRTHAAASHWLVSLDTIGALDELFSPDVRTSIDLREWAHWVRASIDDDDGAVLLDVLARHGGQLHSDLWFQIWHKLYGEFNGSLAHRKLAFVLAAAERDRDDTRLSALVSQIATDDPETSERLLLHLLEPRLHLKVKSGWGLRNDSLETRLRLPWRSSRLRDAWPQLMPRLRDRRHLLTVLLNLIRTVETTDAFFTGSGRAEALSIRRQQVADSGLSLDDDAYILIVDMGRDLLREAVMEHGTADALRLLDDYSEMNRRLALDALAEARSSEADAMLGLLIRRGLPFTFRSRPEVFRLMAAAYKKATDPSKEAFIDYVQNATLAAEDDEITLYDRYNIFVWLSSEVPADDTLLNLRARMEAEHGFTPEPTPNLTSGVSFTESEPSKDVAGIFNAMSAEGMVAELAKDRLIGDEYSNGRILRELGAYLSEFPTRHLEVLDAMIAAESWNDAAWRTVLQGLVRQDNWTAREVLERLHANSASAHAIAPKLDFAVAYPTNDLSDALTNQTERARLLIGLWGISAHETGDSPLTNPAEARNSDRGSLAHYYTEFVLRAAEQDGDDARLSAEATAGLLLLMDAQSANPSDPSPMMVAQYAGFIQWRAPNWFDQHLAPRIATLDSTPQSLTLWAGLLSRGLSSKQMRQLFREPIRTGWVRVAGSLPASTEDFIRFHAVCFARDSTQDDFEWPDALLTRAGPDVRERWIRSIAHYVDGKEAASHDLLLAHWQHRLDGQPAIVPAEQRALLRWLTLPGIDVERGTDFFTSGPTIPADEYGLYDHYDLDEFPREEYPTLYLRVANHLMKDNRFPPPFADQLIQVARTVAADDPQLAWDALNNLLGLGYSPARAVLRELVAE